MTVAMRPTPISLHLASRAGRKRVAPVGAVAALRETSVVFALGLGALLLGERVTPRRWFGVAAVLAGAVTLRV